MKFLLDQLEKVKPLFMPGGKLEKLYPLYEAKDTFLFTPGEVTDRPPHVRGALDTKRMMITVVLALIPCILFGIYNAGHQYNIVNQIPDTGFLDHFTRGAIIVLPIIIVSYAVGGTLELLFCIIRRHEINEGFLVTGMLFPLTLPPTIPLWQVAVGIAFGVVIGKEIFGGTGFNVLNPALTARAFLFFAYPSEITGDNIWTVVKDSENVVDGFTGATPLGLAAVAPEGVDIVEYLKDAGFDWWTMAGGLSGGSIGETAFLACLIGAAVLIISGIGSWRIMTGCVIGLFLGSSLLNLMPEDTFHPFTQLPFHYHLVFGGFAFGAVFMATDPVSSSATLKGKWIYGIMIGLLTVTIRVANPAFPGGVMLAILFMNVMAPVIDHFVLQAHIKSRRKKAREQSLKYVQAQR